VTAAKGVRLMRLAGEHPEPALVREVLTILGADLDVSEASSSALIATLETPGAWSSFADRK